MDGWWRDGVNMERGIGLEAISLRQGRLSCVRVEIGALGAD